ncbi:unnamed protein product [Symbiodinium natans]|uniref:Uncharacterized protein n=1 Tax=Symbiodinium natans TaxID=878477 RepID=A0A812G3S7_9DINO|nr:unnamed protein product [Symbiodinium natans]
MIIIFALMMTLCSPSLPLFTVVRRASLTPSQEARNMVDPTATTETILNVTDYIAEARAREERVLAQIREERALAQIREERALAQARELSLNCTALERQNFLLQRELLPAKTSTAAVLCNRFLVESGLLDRDPTLILSAAYDKFKTKLVTPSGKGLTKAGRSLLSDISWKSGMSARHRDVANGLQMLIHQLSSVIHYPKLVRRGFVCGGHPPLGIAVAMAVLTLQAEGHIGHDVVVIDGDYNPVAEMKGGVISSWPATHAR